MNTTLPGPRYENINKTVQELTASTGQTDMQTSITEQFILAMYFKFCDVI